MQKGFIAHALIRNHEGKMLILRRSEQNDVLPGYWDIPGGTVEEGEKPSAAAIRETKEEAGLDIFNLKLIFQTSNFDQAKNKEFLTLVYSAEARESNIVLRADEHDRFQWINPSDVQSYRTVDYLPEAVKTLERN